MNTFARLKGSASTMTLCFIGFFLAGIAGAEPAATTKIQPGNLQAPLVQSFFLKQMLTGLDRDSTERVALFAKVLQVVQDYHLNADTKVVTVDNVAKTEDLVSEALGSSYPALNDELKFAPDLSKKVDVRNLRLADKRSVMSFAKVRAAFEKFEVSTPQSLIDPNGLFREIDKAQSLEPVEFEVKMYRDLGKRFNLRQMIEAHEANFLATIPTIVQYYGSRLESPRFFADVLGSPSQEAAQWRQIMLNTINRDFGFYGIAYRQAVAKFLEGFTSKLEVQLKDLQNVAERILESGEIKFEKAADQRFFELVIRGYFSNLSREKAKNILKAMLERPDRVSTKDIFRLIVLHADPYIQKLFQAVARRPGFSSELQDIFAELEDGGLPVPWEKVEKKLGRAPKGYTWIKLDRIPWVGTMAQTYPGKVKDAKGRVVDIVARVIKNREETTQDLPAARQRMVDIAKLIDSDPLLRKSNFPLVQPIVDDVVKWAEDELDVSMTRENQREGAKNYSSKVTVNGVTIEFVSPVTLKSANPEVIYSTRIFGDKFPEFKAKYPKLAATVAEEIAKKWSETAMFGDLFFHGDLHPGNLKVRMVNSKTVQVGFFDYGIAGTLKPEYPSIFARLQIAATTKAPSELIAKYIWLLSDPRRNSISLDLLTDQVVVVRKTKARPVGAIDWLSWALSIGLVLEENINILIRGYQTVESLLLISGSQKTFEELNFEVGVKHMGEAMVILAAASSDRRPHVAPVNQEIQEYQKAISSCADLLPASEELQ